MFEVLQVSTFFGENGGVEKSVSDLSHALAEKLRVQVLCTAQGKTTREHIGKLRVTAAGGALAVSGRPLSLSFASEIAKQNVDVAHYHLPCPIAVLTEPFASPAARVRIATWHHGLVRHKAFDAITRPLVDHFLRSMDAIIVTSPQLIEHTPLLKRHYKKCIVIPLGIDEQRFTELDENTVLDLRDKFGTPLLLYVGRLVYYKGCETLIRAIADVPNAKLVMVGRGPLEHKLRALICELGLEQRVHLLGWQCENDLRSLFQACDLFVLPSTLPTECFGLVQVEAMLCGKPVINTDLPTGVPWVSIHEETGLTVQPNDPVALSQAIGKIVGDSEYRKALGANARRRALEKFTLGRQVDAVISFYEQLLSRSQSSVASHEQSLV